MPNLLPKSGRDLTLIYKGVGVRTLSCDLHMSRVHDIIHVMLYNA
jgi:hypothetical protein